MIPGADNPSWSATFPDPFSGGPLTVSIEAERLNHIRTEHVQNRVEQSAWREFLGETLVDAVCRWTGLPGSDLAVVEAFARRFFVALEEPLRHPRLIQYTQHHDDGRPSHKTWEVATRDGIIVVMRHASGKCTVSTAFIPWQAVNEKPNRRGQVSMAARVEWYCKDHRILVEQQPFIIPPPPNQLFPSDKPPGSRTNLTFHQQETWGFRAFEYEGETLIVWDRKKIRPFGPRAPRGPLPHNPLKPKKRPER